MWDATEVHNGGAERTAWETLLEMEMCDVRTNELDEGAFSVDNHSNGSKVSLPGTIAAASSLEPASAFVRAQPLGLEVSSASARRQRTRGKLARCPRSRVLDGMCLLHPVEKVTSTLQHRGDICDRRCGVWVPSQPGSFDCVRVEARANDRGLNVVLGV